MPSSADSLAPSIPVFTAMIPLVALTPDTAMPRQVSPITAPELRLLALGLFHLLDSSSRGGGAAAWTQTEQYSVSSRGPSFFSTLEISRSTKQLFGCPHSNSSSWKISFIFSHKSSCPSSHVQGRPQDTHGYSPVCPSSTEPHSSQFFSGEVKVRPQDSQNHSLSAR